MGETGVEHFEGSTMSQDQSVGDYQRILLRSTPHRDTGRLSSASPINSATAAVAL